jgi:predicted GNAT family N-acyltransferase
MIIMIVAHGSELYVKAVDLRRRVLRWPLGLEFTAEELAAEADQAHFVIQVADKVVACASVVLLPDAAKVRQVAVAPECAGQGLGRAIMAECEQWAKQRGRDLIVLHARRSAEPFYLRLGYSMIGEEFEEVGIPHVRMQLTL